MRASLLPEGRYPNDGLTIMYVIPATANRSKTAIIIYLHLLSIRFLCPRAAARPCAGRAHAFCRNMGFSPGGSCPPLSLHGPAGIWCGALARMSGPVAITCSGTLRYSNIPILPPTCIVAWKVIITLQYGFPYRGSGSVFPPPGGRPVFPGGP